MIFFFLLGAKTISGMHKSKSRLRRLDHVAIEMCTACLTQGSCLRAPFYWRGRVVTVVVAGKVMLGGRGPRCGGVPRITLLIDYIFARSQRRGRWDFYCIGFFCRRGDSLGGDGDGVGVTA